MDDERLIYDDGFLGSIRRRSAGYPSILLAPSTILLQIMDTMGIIREYAFVNANCTF